VAALLRTILSKLAYLLAIIIVIFAILSITARLLTPLFNQHRGDIEKRLSILFNMPVKIEKAAIAWYQYRPEITLDQVSVLNNLNQPILQIHQVRILISIPASIWRRQLVPSGMVVSGTDLHLYQTETGNIGLEKFTPSGASQAKWTDIFPWLMTQDEVILKDINIYYTSNVNNKINNKINKKYFFSLSQLIFQNINKKHRILGKIILHQTIPTELTIAVNWKGEQFDFEKIKAKTYFYVSGLSIPQWMQNNILPNWQIKEGLLSAKIWADWNRGQFQQVQSEFQLYNLSLFSLASQTEQKINRLSGDIGWKRQGDNQIIAGENILIDLPSHLWPVTDFYIFLTKNNNQLKPKIINIGYLDIKDAKDFLLLSPIVLPEQLKLFLTETKPKGRLQNTQLKFLNASNALSEPNNFAFSTHFSGLYNLSWQYLPGIKNLSGTIDWDGEKGNIVFNSYRSTFQFDPLFTHPINLDQLTGKINFQPRFDHNQEEWLLQIASLNALNNDLAISVDGRLIIPSISSKDLPYADLRAYFNMQRASRITRYLPLKIFDVTLVHWLENAFLSGEVKSGQAVLRGYLKNFPFDKNQDEEFSISGKVSNVNLQYAPNWPLLERANGRLLFRGRQMIADVTDAKILNLPINQVQAIIPHLGGESQILKIQSEKISTKVMHGINFLRKSPLEKTLGKMFSKLTLDGVMDVSLGLLVPLKKPEETQVKGNIRLNDVKLNFIPWHFSINKLTGNLNFTEKTITARDLKGEIFNNLININLNTIKNKNMTEVSFITKLNLEEMADALKIPRLSLLSGETDVMGKVDLSFQSPIRVYLQSNLKGITINLPDEYGKKENETSKFSADLTIPDTDKKPISINIAYNNLFNFSAVFNMINNQFKLINLSGFVNQLDWEKIQNFNFQNNQNNKNNLTNLSLNEINIRTNVIKFFGQAFTQAKLQVVLNKNNWDVTINSKEAIGKINIPKVFKPSANITANFQKLNLKSTSSTQSAVQFPSQSFQSLPSISFNAKTVNYNDLPLGQVSFKTYTNNNGINIQNLQIISSRLNLQSTGTWTQSNKHSSTKLKGTAISNNVSDLLNSFGFTVNNFISSKGKLTFDLEWNNPPYAPALNTMSGKVEIDLGPGRILDIGQTSGAKMDLGKMLSIFSLQNIPRRLTFDFSDIFQKGYNFDFFRGNFTLKSGSAYTTNARFDGPVAGVNIDGRIGVVNKDYDFILSVTPYVTSSLPIAATIINPSIGLAAFAANMIIGPAVSKVTTYYYAVKGPWSQPTWVSVSAKRN
jgi:uncharacterized protein YhdP